MPVISALLNIPSARIVGPDLNRKARIVVLDDGSARLWDDQGNLLAQLSDATVTNPVLNREWIVAGRNPTGDREAWTVTAGGGCGCGQ